MAAARRRGQWSDRPISGLSVTGMSISFRIIIIAFRSLCTPTAWTLPGVAGRSPT
jgi:hypothetical protein